MNKSQCQTTWSMTIYRELRNDTIIINPQTEKDSMLNDCYPT